MLKFTFGILILLFSGFLSSQVYTLKTDPDKDKYPEAFIILRDLSVAYTHDKITGKLFIF